MFGFGFSRARTLASAERNVRLGRLQPAIHDYEKLAKDEPRDLHILNTIGDLYARLGRAEQAAEYFRRVGDSYANDGFCVKAIAMYKKLVKQDPGAVEVSRRIAELYAQQGMNNEARMQFTALAESLLKAGDTPAAVRIFHQVLDLDQDNPRIQMRVAGLLAQLGKKPEALEIHMRAAKSLQTRGALAAADEALAKALELDPKWAPALLLRAQVKLEMNDPNATLDCLRQIPEIESRAEGLKLFIRSRLKLGNIEEAAELSGKLLTDFGDLSGLTLCAEVFAGGGNFAAVLQLYKQHEAGLRKADPSGLVSRLTSLIEPLKESLDALQTLYELLRKAGDPGGENALAEVTELLARANAERGNLEAARELYQQLAELDPADPIYRQNLAKIRAQLGEDEGATLDAAAGQQEFPAALQPPPAPPTGDGIAEFPEMFSAELRGQAEVAAHEIDLFDEWERASLHSPSGGAAQDLRSADGASGASVDELLEEARFCISAGMMEQAQRALKRAEELAPDSPQVLELRAQAAGRLPAPQAFPPEGLVQESPGAPANPSLSGDPLGEIVLGVQQAIDNNPAWQQPASPLADSGPGEMSSGVASVEELAADVSLPAGDIAHITGNWLLATEFADFKREVESGAEPSAEDPETHYNMGIAFREMGLMDEAIGELQKVCQAIEQGLDFPQKIQAFTWLAQCFLETGLPEAGVRWYEKALQAKGLETDSILALNYELACAHEAAGNVVEARRHFLQVLSVNIDYRDVAGRIKALKSAAGA